MSRNKDDVAKKKEATSKPSIASLKQARKTGFFSELVCLPAGSN